MAPCHVSLSRLLLLGLLMANLPAAVAEGIVEVDRCRAFDGERWTDCGGYVPVGGSGGVPYYRLEFGVTSSPECGSTSLGGVLSPRSVELGPCWVWVGLLVGNATVPSPNPGAISGGRF